MFICKLQQSNQNRKMGVNTLHVMPIRNFQIDNDLENVLDIYAFLSQRLGQRS